MLGCETTRLATSGFLYDGYSQRLPRPAPRVEILSCHHANATEGTGGADRNWRLESTSNGCISALAERACI